MEEDDKRHKESWKLFNAMTGLNLKLQGKTHGSSPIER